MIAMMTMKFDKKVYWDRRKKGYRGQINHPGTKEFEYEQRKVDKIARKLWLERQKETEAKKELKEDM
jgi:hypothetical protein